MNRCKPLREALRARQGAYWDRIRVAERLGVSDKSLARWEAGEAEPSASDAVRLARELGVTVEQLHFGRGTD